MMRSTQADASWSGDAPFGPSSTDSGGPGRPPSGRARAGKGVDLPIPPSLIALHTVATGVCVPSQLQVFLNAESVLARVGLEQAASEVGLRVSADTAACVASLRTEGAGLPHPEIDVCTDGTRVTVTLGNEPSPQLWCALGRLVQILLPSERPEPSHTSRSASLE